MLLFCFRSERMHRFEVAITSKGDCLLDRSIAFDGVMLQRIIIYIIICTGLGFGVTDKMVRE